ncbi:MAG: N-acetyltransferase family protein [Patescibacteria group bacterium]
MDAVISRDKSEENVGLYTHKPLSSATFPDFERLFGPAKDCGGCWCMWYRLSAADWKKLRGEGCREAMRRLAGEGKAHGLLAYVSEEPVGWCALGPRDDFPRLDRTKAYLGLDRPPGLWSLPCFYIAKGWRGRGAARFLLTQALPEMKALGARVAEAYPVTTTRDGRRVEAAFAWNGPLAMYLEAGFRVVHRANEFRPVVRREL